LSYAYTKPIQTTEYVNRLYELDGGSGVGGLTILDDFLSDTALTLLVVPGSTTVAASHGGSANSTLPGPTLVVSARPTASGSTASAVASLSFVDAALERIDSGYAGWLAATGESSAANETTRSSARFAAAGGERDESSRVAMRTQLVAGKDSLPSDLPSRLESRRESQPARTAARDFAFASAEPLDLDFWEDLAWDAVQEPV
jgi:hypothetical protein